MTERERLIELVDKAKEEYSNDVTDHTETDYIVECLLENGVIVPPCLGGQDIYIVKKNKVEMTFATTFKYYGKEIGVEVEATRWKINRNGMLELKTDILHECDFGKTVFLTREEAEKALAEKQGKEDEEK